MVRGFYLEEDAVLCMIPSTVRLHVTLRLPSGKEIKSWPSTPPYINLQQLQIPGVRRSYRVLKQTAALEDNDRIWKEGEDEIVELTMVKVCEPYILLHIYLCLGFDDDYTAFRFCSVQVPVTSSKTPARVCLEAAYGHLLTTGDEVAGHLVSLLREDLTAAQVLRRDFLQFVTGNDHYHLGDVRAVVRLDDEHRVCSE